MRRKLVLVLLGLLAGLITNELVMQVSAYLRWHWGREQVAATSGSGTARETVLCVGDSFTFGLGASDPGNAYPAAAERELRELDPASTLHFVNAGWPGSDSAAVLARLPRQLEVNHPRFVYVLVGYNDFWSDRVVSSEDGFPLEFRTLRLLKLIAASLRGGPEADPVAVVAPQGRAGAPFLGPWHDGGVWLVFRDDGRVETANGDLPALWSHDASHVWLDMRDSKERTAIEWRVEGEFLSLRGGMFPQGIVLARGLPERNALERGRACVLRGDRDGAQRAFEEASNDPAQAIDARLELANLFSAAGNSAAARPLLDELLAGFESLPTTSLARRLVDALFAAARPADATRVLARVLVELPFDDAFVHQVVRVGFRADTPILLDEAIVTAIARKETTENQRVGLLGLRPVLRGDDDAIAARCLVELARLRPEDPGFVRTVLWNQARFTRERFVAAADALGLSAEERARAIAAFDAARARTDHTASGIAANLARIVSVCRAAGAEPVLLDYPLDRPSITTAVREVGVASGVGTLLLGEHFAGLVRQSSRADWYVADGHCNDRGYVELGRLVARDVASRIKR